MAVKSRPLAMYVVAGVLLSGVFAGPSAALAQENGADAALLSEIAESQNDATNEAANESPAPDAVSAADTDAAGAEPESEAALTPAEGKTANAPSEEAAGPAAPVADADLPRTGFELRGEVDGESWTTQEEELAFLNTLAEKSPRVEFDVLGQSTLGRDLHLVRVGADKPAARADLNEANTAMVTCTQHGNEEAPREACLKLVRDLAFTDDPATVKYLEEVTVVVIPTGNPDGFFAAGADGVVTHDTRTRLLWDGVDAQGNPAPGTDPNRDHLALKTVEGRLMSSLLSEFTPHVALDAHEIPVRGVAGPKPGPNSNPTARYGDAEFLYPRNANVPEDVWKLSKDFVDGAIAGTREAGFDGRYYLSGGDERIMRNVLGLRGTVSVLLESNQNNLDNKDRVRVQTTAMEDVLGYHAENVERVTEMAKKYEASQIKAGKDRAPLFIGGVVPDGNPSDGVGTLPGGEPLATMEPAPACYTLTDADYDKVQDQLKGHNVVVDKLAEGYQIDLAQKARPMIPYIVDDASMYAEVSAVRSETCADVMPRTGFELRGEVDGESWTTQEEELAFLNTLAEKSPRVEFDVLGKSTLGRDLHLVRVGADKPAARADLNEANTAMVTCTQHGNEEAPREACLKLVRDLAFTDDPAMVKYLEEVTVVVIPTGNPDGFFAAGADGVVTHDTRTRLLWDGVDAQGNPAPGTDPNRDHLALKTVEGRLMSSLLSEFTPHVALDAHEIPVRGEIGPKPGPNSDPTGRYGDAEFLYPRNANVPEDVWKLSKDFVDGAIAGTREAGFDGRYYLSGGDERIMRNVLGLRGTVSVLLESNQNFLNNTDRVRVQTTAMEDVLGYHAENVERVTGMAKKYEASQVKAGKDRAPLFIGGVVPDGNPSDGVGTLPGGDPLKTMDPAPACYTLSDADYDKVQDQLKGHNVVVDKVAEGYQIDLAQKARPMIPYIVDGASQYAEIAAVESAECAEVDPGTENPGTGTPGGEGDGNGNTTPVSGQGDGKGTEGLSATGSEGIWLPLGLATLLLAAGLWAVARKKGHNAESV